MNSLEILAAVRRWIRFAREDLEAAEGLLDHVAFQPRHVCWLAQQATEKALKGALTLQQIPFPYHHDLDALRNLLPEGWEVKVRHPDLAELTEWAVESRYPGDWPDASVDDARRAAEAARSVYECILSDLGRHGVDLLDLHEPEGNDIP